MSTKAVSSQTYVALTQELAGIQDKRFLDDRWFDFDDEGHLTLVDRPLDCLSQIWECIVRLFTSKLANLENKFTLIADQVDAYLRNEQDLKRLDEFLGHFTPALNELYRCAGRMQQAQRISEQVLQQMQAKKRIQDFVIVPRNYSLAVMHNGVMHPKYCAKGTIRLSSSVADANVSFWFYNRSGVTWQDAQAFRRELYGSDASEYPVHNAFDDIRDVNEVHTRVSYGIDFPRTGTYAIHIDEKGKPEVVKTYPGSDADPNLIVIVNRSDLIIYFSEGQDRGMFGLGQNVVAPKAQTSTKRPENADVLRFTFSHSPPVQNIALNFKDGFYECAVDKEGLHVSAGMSLEMQHKLKPAADQPVG